MLWTYFSLQGKVAFRKLKSYGLNPFIALAGGAFLFVFFSKIFFSEFGYAHYFYPLIAFFFLLKYADTDKDEFLKSSYSHWDFRKIKLLENILIAFPFLLFLSYETHFLEAAVLLAIVGMVSFFTFTFRWNFSWPTPFYRYPFEFAVGFRSNWIFLLFSYGITAIAIYANNVNLGVFTLLLPLFISAVFYQKPEPVFFVWMYALNVEDFLKHKLKIAIRYGFLLTLPIIAVFLWFYPEAFLKISLVEIIGLGILISSVLSKYAVFPEKSSSAEAMTLFLSLIFPPFMFLFIPNLYQRAKQNLQHILAYD